MNIPHRFLTSIQRRLQQEGRTLLLGIALLLGTGGIALAVIAPDVANTRHNLSASNTILAAPLSSFGTTVKATSETQICVFCHTPHAATTGSVAPLWNRTLSTQTYSFYKSSSMDASPAPGENVTLPGVGVGSKLCLSCHDGTLAIGTVGVLNNAPGNIAMQGTGTGGVMPDGAGANTGFTRKIGIDLTNDHPISFTYDAAQAGRDGELYTPGAAGVAVGSRVRGQPKPQFPLVAPLGDTGSQVECITCHDPHLKSDAVDVITGQPIDNKFLRGNRLQGATPVDNGVFNPATDIMCLACHNKPGWAISTHGNVTATSEIFTDNAADLRDFPRDTAVWQSSCLACHDVHTVPGSRRLLREATDSIASPKSGGNSAIEQACYQCHSPAGIATRALVEDIPDQVPDIKTDFNLPPPSYRMPIATAEQGLVPYPGGPTNNTTEIHDIGLAATGATDTAFPTSNVSRGKDMLETRSQLGAGTGAENLINRHAECPDCHQPHRLTRTQLFNGDPNLISPSGTHRHAGSGDPGSVPHNNLASGSQRGAFGVEPVYGSNSFYAEPFSFTEKRGPVPVGASTDVNSTYLTREYQICAKCHSNYGFGSNPPSLGRDGGTPSGTNGMLIYTNVFREIQAPVAHMGNATPGDSGAHNGMTPYSVGPNYVVDFTTNNRRSWHPVLGPTGRHADNGANERNASATNWLFPWTNDVGDLTMYCTDCHGSSTPAGQSHQATDGPPEGPHGSQNIFLLKGWWDQCTGMSIFTTTPGCLNAPASVATGVDAAGNPTTTSPKNTAVRPTDDLTQDLCFKCHNYNTYASWMGAADSSGYGGPSGSNLHSWHAGSGNNAINVWRCMWCHVAVPHGWKNKAFLVNLNDVGPEATCRQEDADDVIAGYKCTETVGLGNPMPPGTQVRNVGAIPGAGGYWASIGYTNPPYYRNAIVKIVAFAPSGAWNASNCGSIGAPGTGVSGGWSAWMGGNEGCSGPP